MEKILCIFVLGFCAIASASVLNNQPGSRITGGFESYEAQFPYAVSLQQISQGNTLTRGHRCGGVLITSRHVLTAASCTFTPVPNAPPVAIAPGDYRVFAGSVSLVNDGSPERYRFVVSIDRHPGYIGYPASINDVAVLTLNTPFNNSVASPLALPPADFIPAENTPCVVAGWGSQNYTDTVSITQRYIRKYISNQDLCRFQYNLQENTPNIIPSMICALPFDVTSAGCTGDLGNGLVCNGGLTGILSINRGCGIGYGPEVYTRVSNYTSWIRDATSGVSTFQPGLAVLMLFSVVQLITAKIIS